MHTYLYYFPLSLYHTHLSWAAVTSRRITNTRKSARPADAVVLETTACCPRPCAVFTQTLTSYCEYGRKSGIKYVRSELRMFTNWLQRPGDSSGAQSPTRLRRCLIMYDFISPLLSVGRAQWTTRCVGDTDIARRSTTRLDSVHHSISQSISWSVNITCEVEVSNLPLTLNNQSQVEKN